jgi:simple sugar transport system permease protein
MSTFIALVIGISLSLLSTLVAGENPFHILTILVESCFGSWYDAGTTLFYATPLMFTGLSVSLAFRTGLFNIGAEGQLIMGSLAATGVGIGMNMFATDLSPGTLAIVAVPLACTAAFAGGAIWGLIPGFLLVKRGSHEVITTIMLNFIAAGIAQYFVLSVWPNEGSQNPETEPVSHAVHLGKLSPFSDSPFSNSFFFAIILSLFLYIMAKSTAFGFALNATGQNPQAARASGIQTDRVKIIAMALAGGLAGLVALPEIMGNSHRFKLGFSPGYGFTGIAVALLAKGNPIGVIFAALLFGALHKGTADLDFQTEHITRDFSLVLQALIILSLAASTFLQKSISEKFRSWRQKR